MGSVDSVANLGWGEWGPHHPPIVYPKFPEEPNIRYLGQMKSGGRNSIRVTSAVLAAALLGCLPDNEIEELPPPPPTPATFEAGQALFDGNCARCHGAAARGTDVGPPLVHRIYEPNHHADISFYRAVEFGVAAHHWRFGSMQRVEGVARDDVTQIIGYLRWLQQEAGIF